MLPDEKIWCHRTGFEKTCRDMVCNKNCQLWVRIDGYDVNTGITATRYGCSDAFIPMLQIEIAQRSREAGASFDAMKNEVFRQANNPQLGAPRVMDVQKIASHAKPLGQISKD